MVNDRALNNALEQTRGRSLREGRGMQQFWIKCLFRFGNKYCSRRMFCRGHFGHSIHKPRNITTL